MLEARPLILEDEPLILEAWPLMLDISLLPIEKELPD
jgi:hypothetical protein